MSRNKLVLPQFEHSYETIIHKNVYSFCILIIPIGIPSYIWIRQDGIFLQNERCEAKPSIAHFPWQI